MSQEADQIRDRRRAFAAPGSPLDRAIRVLAVALPALVGAVFATMLIAPLSPRGEVSFILDRNKVDVAQNPAHRLDRRAGVEHHPRLAAERADELDGAVQVRAGLRVDRQDRRPGLGEGGNIGIDRGDHQVDVERQPGMRLECLEHDRAYGDVGHEMPVHHVDMDEIRTSTGDCRHLAAQRRKVGRENRRGDPHRLAHDRT